MSQTIPLGERLKEERLRLGLNQDALGVTPQAQRRYEKGERYPDAEYLARFADLGGDVQYIVTGKRSEGALVAEEERLVYAFRQLKDSAREAVANMIDTFAAQAAAPPRRKLPDTLPGEVKDVDDDKPAARARRQGKA